MLRHKSNRNIGDSHPFVHCHLWDGRNDDQPRNIKRKKEERKMKKAYTIIFLLLITSLVACGSKDEVSTPEPVTAETDTSVETVAEPVVPVVDDATAVFNATAQQNMDIVLTALQACPQRTFPLPEPDYNSKRK